SDRDAERGRDGERVDEGLYRLDDMIPEPRRGEQLRGVADRGQRRGDRDLARVFVKPLPDRDDQREEDAHVEAARIGARGRGGGARAHYRVRRLRRRCSQRCSAMFMTVTIRRTKSMRAYIVRLSKLS